MGQRFSVRLVPLLLIFCTGAVIGCLSSQSARDQSAREEAADRAAVIGTWEYEVQGVAPLERGTFRITIKKGRLRGIIRDRRRGRIRARVEVNDSRLELSLDNLRISGHIENDEFTGSLRRHEWDITASSSRNNVRSRFRPPSAYLFARRVESAAAADTPSILECRPILREANGCN